MIYLGVFICKNDNSLGYNLRSYLFPFFQRCFVRGHFAFSKLCRNIFSVKKQNVSKNLAHQFLFPEREIKLEIYCQLNV